MKAIIQINFIINTYLKLYRLFKNYFISVNIQTLHKVVNIFYNIYVIRYIPNGNIKLFIIYIPYEKKNNIYTFNLYHIILSIILLYLFPLYILN